MDLKPEVGSKRGILKKKCKENLREEPNKYGLREPEDREKWKKNERLLVEKNLSGKHLKTKFLTNFKCFLKPHIGRN